MGKKREVTNDMVWEGEEAVTPRPPGDTDARLGAAQPRTPLDFSLDGSLAARAPYSASESLLAESCFIAASNLISFLIM